MATPSVLTVPSMYGDGILYSGPTVFSNELVTNGNFQTDTDWTKGAGVTISNGNANFINAPGVALYQNIGTQSGFVRVEFNITEYTSGTLNIYSGGNQAVGNVNVVGNKIGRYTAKVDRNGGNNNIIFGSSDNFTGSITNVSVKEITQGSDFDFTRATTGTRINEEGYIEDVPYNLLTYSTDFTFWTQADVSTVPIEDSFDGSGDAYKVSITGGTGFQTIRKTGLNVSGQQTFSIYAKKDTLNFTRILFGGVSRNFWVDLVNGTQGTTTGSYDSITITNAGNGFFRIVATFTATSPVTHIYLYPSTANGNVNQSSGSVIFQYAQLVKGDQPKDYLPTTDRVNLPRLNYPVYGGCPSLLVEPQSTNLIPFSEDFTNAYFNKFNSNITSNFDIAPNGTKTANKFFSDTNNSAHTFYVFQTVSANAFTFSLFVKKLENKYIQIQLGSNFTDTYSNINLETGVVEVQSGHTTKVEEYNNGWYKISATATSSGTSGYFGLALIETANASRGASFQGDNKSGVLIWGGQFEQQSYATSYIPTSGSTVTRNEDKALYAGLGTTDTFNDSEGVLFIETEALVNEVNARGISINAGNGLNRVLISYPSSGNSSITGYLQSTAGSGAGMTITGIDTTQKHKVAIKYKLNDTSLFIDGVKRAVDTSVVMPVGLKQLDFSNGISVNTAEYEGNLNAIAVYKTALTDTELANLTSYNNHDLFIPYRSRMQMISADQELQCTEHDITRFL